MVDSFLTYFIILINFLISISIINIIEHLYQSVLLEKVSICELCET